MACKTRRPQVARHRLLWETIRQTRRFTATELHAATRVPMTVVYRYLSGLRREGYIQLESFGSAYHGQFRVHIYNLVRDHGAEVPQVPRAASTRLKEKVREQIWRSIRILREFTATELRVTATTPTAPVNDYDIIRYLRPLHRAGYLWVMRKPVPGRLARYRLLRTHNTGPQPPVMQRNGELYDPNLGRIVWKRPAPTPAAPKEDPADE